MTDQLRYLVASPNHEGRETKVKPTSEDLVVDDVPIFTCFLTAGLVPPLSDFYKDVMEEYGFRLQ